MKKKLGIRRRVFLLVFVLFLCASYATAKSPHTLQELKTTQNISLGRAIGGPFLSFFIGFGTGFFLMEDKFFRAWIYLGVDLATLVGGAAVSAMGLDQSFFGSIFWGLYGISRMAEFIHSIIYAVIYTHDGPKDALYYQKQREKQQYAFSRQKFITSKLPHALIPEKGYGGGLGFSVTL